MSKISAAYTRQNTLKISVFLRSRPAHASQVHIDLSNVTSERDLKKQIVIQAHRLALHIHENHHEVHEPQQIIEAIFDILKDMKRPTRPNEGAANFTVSQKHAYRPV